MIGLFFNDTATTEIYTLSLHDALPIFIVELHDHVHAVLKEGGRLADQVLGQGDLLVIVLVHEHEHVAIIDRKSTRLNSSHANISYAVFCLKKNKIPVIFHQNTLLVPPP